MVYYNCCVPGCVSTTVKTPDKYFFNLPMDNKRRLKWIHAIRRSPKDISMKTGCLKVCQDHFNLQEDLENYVKFTLKGGKIHRLKQHVVPHIFDCQPDRSVTHSGKRRSAVEKLFRVQQLKEIFEGESSKATLDERREEEIIAEPVSPSANPTIPSPTKIRHLESEAVLGLCQLSKPICEDKYTQTIILKTTSDATVQCTLLKEATRTPTPPLSLTSESTAITNSSGSWEVSGSSASLESVSTQGILLKRTMTLCRSKPLRYLGLSEDCLGLVNILSKNIKCAEKCILICLMKIRLNHTFGELGDLFELSSSHTSRIFCKYVVPLADVLKEFIFWPQPEIIRRNLPLAFRENFRDIQSIIDCFEVQIEQPSDPIKQTLTWSEYKKANTIKYLVSSTPNGFINFISKGYGGRTSDMKLLKLSGYLNVLPKGCRVMADRGFKGVATYLEEKGCKLIRPPSAAAGEKLSRLQVITTRQIASLRIHIERVIRRLRDYHIDGII